MFLTSVASFLEQDGTPVKGCCMEEAEGIALARQHAPDKPFCTVRQWMLVDVTASDAEKASLAAQGYLPIILYAHEVVTDSRRRFRPGDWVRSTFLIELSQGCLFETGNTIYVLLGDGCRKQVDPKVLTSIF